MKVAFYGAGPRAQPYLQALARRPDITLTGVCDPDRREAEVTAAGWGAKVHLSYDAMLEEARPNALWICVAEHLQSGVIDKAIELNLPFFVEPPGAANYHQALAHGRHVARSELVTAVGFTNRYADVVQEAREYLGANPVPLALAWWLHPADSQHTAGAAELLWSEACRLVDALRAFCGEVDRVRALAAGTDAGGIVVQLEFTGGSVGVLTCASFARPEPRRELEFMGDGWSLSFGDGFSTVRLAERDKTTILRCLNNPATEHVTAFLAAAEARDPAAVAAGYNDALQTLAVCHAAALSIREARPVRIAEVNALTERISQPQGKSEGDAQSNLPGNPP